MKLSVQDYLTFQPNFNSAETVATYDELPLWSATFGLMLLRHIELRRNLQVLDVGCGTGFPLLELAQRLGPSSMVYGIDPWEAAVEKARFKAHVWNLRNVELSVGNAAAMPFPKGQFDLIVSNLGINNFNDPAAALTECRRVSKPTARIVLTTNLKGHMKEFYDVFESTLLEFGNSKSVSLLQEHIDKRATIQGIASLFEKSGWRISTIHEALTSLRFVDGSALLRHYFMKLGFLDGWRGVISSAEEEEVFSRLEANLNCLAETNGVLELTIPMAYVEGKTA